MRSILIALGALLGAASLASLIQRLFEVGLAPISNEMLSYYRWFITDVVRVWLFDWWTIRWLGFQLPNWALDLIALYTVQLGSLYRSLAAEPKRGIIWIKRYKLYFVLALLPIIGVIVALSSLIIENRSLKDLRIWMGYLSVFLAVALFFTWNAFELSP